MSNWLSSKHIEELPVGGLSNEVIFALIFDAAKQLGWTIGSEHSNGLIAYTYISRSAWNEAITIRLEDQTVFIQSESSENQLLSWGRNKRNVESFIQVFEELNEKNQAPGSANNGRIWTDTIAQLKEPALPPFHRNDAFISGFIKVIWPVNGYTITPILICIHLLMFGFMLLAGASFLLPDNQALLVWGTDYRNHILQGESWRLLTANFLHLGIMHLLINMFAFAFIGAKLEAYLGPGRFLTAVLITGATSSVASIGWNNHFINAGASGMVFGLYGVFVSLMSFQLIDKSLKLTHLSSIMVFAGYTVFRGFLPGSVVDNAAHIGGFLSGIIVGIAFVLSLRKPDSLLYRYGTIGLLWIIFLFAQFEMVKSLEQGPMLRKYTDNATIRNDVNPSTAYRYKEKTEPAEIYRVQIERLLNMEKMALDYYQLPYYATRERKLKELKERGIYYWNENLKITDSMERLDLPVQIKIHNHKLRKYCQLRLQSYQLIYKSIDENTSQYDDEIKAYDDRINDSMEEIKEYSKRLEGS